jgi:hypothetical protein
LTSNLLERSSNPVRIPFEVSRIPQSPELRYWALRFWVLIRRYRNRGGGVVEKWCGAASTILCDAPPGAGDQRPVAQEGAAQMDRNRPTCPRICAGKRGGYRFAGEAA